MLIPLANAIFDDDIDVTEFIETNIKKNKKIFFKNLNFKNVDEKIFPLFKLKSKIFEYPSTPIIINAANEVIVGQFLKKRIPFSSFYNLILGVLRDRNYRKYAVKEPKNLNQIYLIDKWTRSTTLKKIECL